MEDVGAPPPILARHLPPLLQYPRLAFQTRSSMEIAVSVSDDSEVACFSFNRKNLLDFDFQMDFDTLQSGRRDGI